MYSLSAIMWITFPKMGMHFFTVFFLSLLSILLSMCNAQTNTAFEVGVILDADTPVGRIGMTSLSLALSDFYLSNPNYSTRLALHIRDSRELVTGAAASGIFSFPFATILHTEGIELMQRVVLRTC